MQAIKPVSPENFGGKFWKRSDHYFFAAGYNIIPVVGAELSKAAAHLPLTFTELAGVWELCALTSLNPGVNLLVGPQGQWLGEYVPASLKGYPFALAMAGTLPSDGYIICSATEGEHLVSQEEGRPFFDDQGKPTDDITRIGNFLADIEGSRAKTRRAVTALKEAGLLKEWDLTASHNGEARKVPGFYTFDEVAFNNLSSKAVDKLQKAGAISIGFAQLYSKEQFSRLQAVVQQQEILRAASPVAQS